jgi:hypothetical protein
VRKGKVKGSERARDDREVDRGGDTFAGLFKF